MAQRRALDPAFYHIEGDELVFFKSQTGIQDDDELKEHILAVQSKAYHEARNGFLSVYGYNCIRGFGFTTLKISKLPGYHRALKLGKERDEPILLDLGCCFGNDLRKAVQDGFPVTGAIASDLRPDFWKLGHELFKSTPETFPAAFVPGDAFDPEFISPRKPFTDIPDGPNPTLDSLTSLTPLQGRISAIHASSFFHLFDEEKQFQLAKQVASLLSPLPGSIIFGIHGGRSEKGFSSFSTSHGNPKFCHSPESWTALWDGEVFSQGTVKVEAGLRETKRADGLQSTLLWWSIIRL
ncbi:hypothetical protein C8J56DRAFT_793698 [Mycena floridula]|nr:hypothetical protein C8J56DRAFT_793698 [Mycena floridula]